MRYLLLLSILVGCSHWEEEHAARCAAWMQRAANKSDSLNVEMQCATIAAAHNAEVEAAIAAGLAAGAMGSAASRK